MKRIRRHAGETRPVEFRLSNVSFDTLAQLDTATLRVGVPGQPARFVATVEVVDAAALTVRALAPAGGWPAAHVNRVGWSAVTRLVWQDGTVEDVPGDGFDLFILEPEIGVV